jgi:hypothetical protein
MKRRLAVGTHREPDRFTRRNEIMQPARGETDDEGRFYWVKSRSRAKGLLEGGGSKRRAAGKAVLD